MKDYDNTGQNLGPFNSINGPWRRYGAHFNLHPPFWGNTDQADGATKLGQND